MLRPSRRHGIFWAMFATCIKAHTGKLSPASVKKHLAATRMPIDRLPSARFCRSTLRVRCGTQIGARRFTGPGADGCAGVQLCEDRRGDIDAGSGQSHAGEADRLPVSREGERLNVVPPHHLAQDSAVPCLEAAEFGEDRRKLILQIVHRTAGSTGGPGDVAGDPDDQAPGTAGNPIVGNPSTRPPETGITEYLRNGEDLEVAAQVAGHVPTRTRQRKLPSAGALTKRRNKYPPNECDTELFPGSGHGILWAMLRTTSGIVFLAFPTCPN